MCSVRGRFKQHWLHAIPLRILHACCRRDALRAKYGESASKPALHCTDLVSDGPLECEAMFTQYCT